MKIIKMDTPIYYTNNRYKNIIAWTMAFIMSTIHLITGCVSMHIFVHAYPVPYDYGCSYDYKVFYTIGIILAIVSMCTTMLLFIIISLFSNLKAVKLTITTEAIISGYIVPIYMVTAYLFGISQCMKNIELYSLTIYVMCIINVLHLSIVMYIDHILSCIIDTQSMRDNSINNTHEQDSIELLESK